MSFFQDIKNTGLGMVSSGIVVFEIIDINHGAEKVTYCNVIALKKSQKDVQITHKQHFTAIDAAVAFIAKEVLAKIPVIMVFNGQKIINRMLYARPADTGQDIVKSILPDIEPEKLVSNRFVFDDGQHFVSITRKSYTEGLMEAVQPLAKRITGYMIGPSILFSTYRLLNKAELADIRFLNYHFRLEDNLLKSFDILPHIEPEALSRLYQLEGRQLEECYLIAYCTGLKYLMHPYYTISELTMSDGQDAELYVYDKLSKPVLITTLTLLLVLNLISNIYTGNKTDKKKKIANAIILTEEELKSENALYSNKQREINAAKDLNIMKHSTTSFYTDQVVKSIPHNVYITRMNVHPLLSNSTDDPDFDQHTITIAGNCYSSRDLGIWVEALKGYEWIKSVTLDKFGNTGDNNNKLTGYTITIIKK